MYKMDRRKSKLNNIVLQFKAIIDETKVLRENIEHVINEVFSCVEYVKQTSGDSGPKTTEILKYELELLTKLVDMNSVLENIWNLNLTDNWNIPLRKYAIDDNLWCNEFEINNQNADPQIVGLPNTEKLFTCYKKGILNLMPYSTCVPYMSKTLQEDMSIPHLPSDSIHSRDVSQNDTQIETQSVPATRELISLSQSPQNSMDDNIPQCNKQIARQQLKLWNEKFGFNSISFSNMQDYKKSNETRSETPGNTSMDSFSHQYVNSDAQQIPERLERDTNELTASQMNESTMLALVSDKVDITSKVDQYIKTDIKTPCSLSDSSELSTGISENISSPHKRNELLVYSSTEASNSIEESISEHTTDEKGVPFISVCRESSVLFNSEDKPVKSTALKKLNNYHVQHVEELKADSVELLHIPDISLKPTKSENIPSYILKDERLHTGSKEKRKKNNQNKHGIISYDLKSKQIPKVGDTCMFSHIESPSEFYLHIVDEETVVIDKLTEQIVAHYKNTNSQYNSKKEASNSIGKYCCAFIPQCNNAQWYRVSILDWKFNESDDVLVQLVDFGNKEITSYRNLRNLTKELSTVSILSVKCHFPLMYPPGSTYLNRLSEWPQKSTDALYDLGGVSEECELVYVGVEPNSIAVDLQKSDGINDDVTLGQVLLDLGYAIQLVDHLDEQDMDLEEFLRDTNDLETAENVNESVMGYDPRDEARICRFTKADGTCFKGKHCKLEHTSLPKDGFTTDTEFVFREAFYQLCLPLPKDTVTILITGYIDPCSFYAHIVRDPQRESKYQIEKDLFELEKVMNTDKMVRTYEPFKISPAIGEMVLVKDWTKKYRRAVVRHVEYANNGSPLRAQVFILDFGETLTVDMINVKKIKPQFLQLPFQAVECYISDYKANTKCNQKEAKEFFDRNLYFQNFFAYVMSSILPLKIQMKSLNGLNIGEVLENLNFAEKCLRDNNPLEDCSLDFY